MSQTEVKVRCPLVWEYDGSGTWEAVSRIMDPDMTDEPVERWNRDWCLMWRIHVTEEGQFCCDQSDRLLIDGRAFIRHCLNVIDQVKGVIDLAEQENREMLTFQGGEPVRLLSPETYNNRRRSL